MAAGTALNLRACRCSGRRPARGRTGGSGRNDAGGEGMRRA